MKRRLLSALLAMAMLLTMVPAAFAADGDTPGESMEPTENISAPGNEPSETPDELGAPDSPGRGHHRISRCGVCVCEHRQ